MRRKETSYEVDNDSGRDTYSDRSVWRSIDILTMLRSCDLKIKGQNFYPFNTRQYFFNRNI